MKAEKIPLKNSNPVLSLAYSKALKLVAIGQMGDSKGSVCLSLWNPYEKKMQTIVEEDPYQNITAVSFDFRDKYLMYADNSSLYKYEIFTKNKIVLNTDNSSINKIGSSKTSPHILVSGKWVEVFNIDVEKAIWRLKDYQAEEKTQGLHIEGLPDEWGLSAPLPEIFNDRASAEIFEEGNAVLVTGHNQGKVQQIDITTGLISNEIFPAPLQSSALSLGCSENVVAVSATLPYANFLWDLKSGKRIAPEIFNERFGGYSSLCLHPKERVIANGTLVGYVSLQKVDTGVSLFSKQIHESRVGQVIFGDDYNTVFSGGDDGQVFMINT